MHVFVAVCMHTCDYISVSVSIYWEWVYTYNFNSSLNTAFLFFCIYNFILQQWENWFLFSLIYLFISSVLFIATSFLPLLLPPVLCSCSPHCIRVLDLSEVPMHSFFSSSVYSFLTLLGLSLLVSRSSGIWHCIPVSLSIWMPPYFAWTWYHMSVNAYTWTPSLP